MKGFRLPSYRVSHDLLVDSHHFLVASHIFFSVFPRIFWRFLVFFDSTVLISNRRIPINYRNEPNIYGIRPINRGEPCICAYFNFINRCTIGLKKTQPSLSF